jgi:uncharacterized protein YjdB
MKKALFGIMACLALFSFVLTGCDDLVGAVKGKDVTGITLDKTTLALTVGGTGTLIATIVPADADNKNVTWSSSNTGVATVTGGVVTGVGAGTATIIAASVNGLQANCAVTVTGGNVPPADTAVTGVTLDKTTLELGVGKGAKLTATVAPADATNKAVTWSSDNTAVATVNGGVVTGVAAGTATITVTTADGNKTTTCPVTVTADGGGEDPDDLVPDTAKAVNAVTLDKQTLPIEVGKTGTLTPTIAPADATNKAVTWSSSDDAIATVNGGVVTGVAVGTATITVTTGDGNKTATCTVTVTATADPGKDPVTPGQTQATITITGIRTDLLGKTFWLGIFPEGTSSEDLISSDPSAGGEGTISSNGTATTKLYDASSSEDAPWSSSNKNYVAGLYIVKGDNSTYAGYAPVSFSNETASIGFSQFDEVEISVPVEPPNPPGPGEDNLTNATSWNESQWSNWFGTHPASDSMNSWAVEEFTSTNGWWISSNPWWNSLYSAWTGSAGPVEPPYPPGPGGDDVLAGATDWDQYAWADWFNSNPASDSNNSYAVSGFAGTYSSWISSNPWWNSFFGTWLGGGFVEPEPSPGPGDDVLAGATNWSEFEWADWFNNNPASDLNNSYAVSGFAGTYSSWISSNPWWNSFFDTWIVGGTVVPETDEPPPGPGPEPGNDGGTLAEAKGKLTLSGFDEFNGKYVYSALVTTSDETLLGTNGVEIIGNVADDAIISMVRISGGYAEVPLYTMNPSGTTVADIYTAYEGSETFQTVAVMIIDDSDGRFTASEAESFATSYAAMISSNPSNTSFTPSTYNGDITIDWNDVMTMDEMIAEMGTGNYTIMETVKYMLMLPQ